MMRLTLLQTPGQGSWPTDPPEARSTDVAFGVGGMVGVALVALWVMQAPRLGVKRFGTAFWLGLAMCAIIGPLLGRILAQCSS